MFFVIGFRVFGGRGSFLDLYKSFGWIGGGGLGLENFRLKVVEGVISGIRGLVLFLRN